MLDAEDSEMYDRAINILKQNQQKIITSFNNQMSLSKQLIYKWSKNQSEVWKRRKGRKTNYFEAVAARSPALGEVSYNMWNADLSMSS